MQGTAVRRTSRIGSKASHAEIVHAVERRRRGQQAEVIGAFRQQPVDEARVDAFRREHRVGDSLRRILVVVETGGAERQIEVGHDRIELQVAGDRPGDVVGDGRRPDPAPRPDDRDGTADRPRVGCREQARHRAHHVEHGDRRHEVVAHAAAHELAVEHNVVELADHQHARAGVAHFSQRIEAADQIVAAAFQFDDHDVGGRRRAVGLDGCRNAAGLDLEMGLAHAPILAGRLHCGGRLRRLAERLNRDAGDRRDMLLARRVGRRGLGLSL